MWRIRSARAGTRRRRDTLWKRPYRLHAVEQARLATQRQRPNAQRQDPADRDGIHVIPHRRLAARLLQDPLHLRGESRSLKIEKETTHDLV